MLRAVIMATFVRNKGRTTVFQSESHLCPQFHALRRWRSASDVFGEYLANYALLCLLSLA